jgi:uncharacterized protein YbjQ (UPF0145 family)
MSPFGFLKRLGGDDDDDGGDALERRREQDIERIEQGGLPASAHERLTELAAREDFFTSGLAVSDFALTTLHEVRPVAQVMGSSVYKVGWQRYPWGSSWSGGSITELRTLTDAWNRARTLAIGRLDQEARLAGADAVIDVSFENRRHEFLDDEIEIVINGTAVRMPPTVAPRADGAPRLSDLSTADVTLLHRSGYDVAGIVCATSVTYVSASAQTRRATVGWQRFSGNVELTDFTQGVYTARENALGRAQADAARLGADGVVGVDLDVDVEVREWEQNDTKYEDLVVTVHVLGTAITQRGEHEPMNPGLIVRQGGQSP